MEIKTIDVWGQPALPQMVDRVPEVKRLFEKSGSADVFLKAVPSSKLIEMMDAAGIDKMLLSAWHRPEGSVLSNDELAEYIKGHRDRLFGVAAVDLKKPHAAVLELRRAISELGFKALRVVPWLWDSPPNHRLYYPLYSACIDLDIPFCTQVGHTGPLLPSETGRPIPYLDQVALDFPELRIVAGHIGYPWTEEMIGVAWKHDNVYIDTSAYLPKYYPKELIRFASRHGRGKVMFGSNYPQLDLKKCKIQLEALQMDERTQAEFQYSVAKKVFKL